MGLLTLPRRAITNPTLRLLRLLRLMTSSSRARMFPREVPRKARSLEEIRAQETLTHLRVPSSSTDEINLCRSNL